MAAVLVNVIAIVVRYTSYFSPFLVKDLPLNVPDLRNYIADHMRKATNPFVYLANTGGLYLSAEEYQTLLDDMFSIHWTGQPSAYVRQLGEDRVKWHRRCWDAFRIHEDVATWDRPVLSLTMNMVAFWVQAWLFKCSYKHQVLSSLLDVGASTFFADLQASSVWVRDFKHPGFSSLCVQACMLQDPVP